MRVADIGSSKTDVFIELGRSGASYRPRGGDAANEFVRSDEPTGWPKGSGSWPLGFV